MHVKSQRREASVCDSRAQDSRPGMKASNVCGRTLRRTTGRELGKTKREMKRPLVYRWSVDSKVGLTKNGALHESHKRPED